MVNITLWLHTARCSTWYVSVLLIAMLLRRASWAKSLISFMGGLRRTKSSNVIRWHRGWQTLWFPRCLSPSTVAITLPHGPHKSFSTQLTVMQTNQCTVYFTTLSLGRSVRRHRTSNFTSNKISKKALLSEHQCFTPAFGYIVHAMDMQKQMLYVHLEGVLLLTLVNGNSFSQQLQERPSCLPGTLN